ncbi:diguanylate cyclase regulator RdcB family protein [Pantoea sp.]|uniref:diguanylate cyclase regulator RdcB family protein n=1 Tax=Pantoea sp. TaxID=69393 RepID=UPI0039E2A99B
MMSLFKQCFPEMQACQVLESIPEKFIVDFANGLDVVDDHLRHQQNRPFFQRLKEGISGQSAARQQAINAAVHDGLQASLTWLTELTLSQAKTNFAVSQVNDRVNALMQDTANIAHYSADTRELLLELSDKVHLWMANNDEQLKRIDSVQRGQLHLDRVLSQWSAGRYAAIPIASRCYVALEELRWGAFGEVIRDGEVQQSQQLIETLKNRVLTQMAQDYGRNGHARHDIRNWLSWQQDTLQTPDWPETLSWLADWSTDVRQPMCRAVTQPGAALPLRIPRICSAERIAATLVDEVFSREHA